jgi:transposase InsO family protein
LGRSQQPRATSSSRWSQSSISPKWIEARPLATITSTTIRKFFWQQIICRFGVPRELTVDNGKQFDCQDFREYCRSIGTKLCFASVYHPQSNGAVERANGQIFSAIKKFFSSRRKENGRMNYRGSFGRITPQSQELPSSLHSDYYTGPTQCALKSSPTKAPEFW